jgi:nucleoside-diphosphate-sugar epimerase
MQSSTPIKNLRILIIGNGYIATYLKKKIKKNSNLIIYLLPIKKFSLKKKIKNIDLVIHTIGLNLYQSYQDHQKAIEIKEKYTKKIIKFCKLNKIMKILYLSSILVYMKKPSGKIDENTTIKNKKNPYAMAHIAAENMLKESSQENLKVIIARCSNFFGINNITNKKQLFGLNNILQDAVIKKKIRIDNPVVIKDFIPLSYFVKILPKLLLFKRKVTIININYKTYRMIELAKIVVSNVKKLFDYTPVVMIKKNKSTPYNLSYNSIHIKKQYNQSDFIKEIVSSLKFLKNNKQKK